jgi:hypothetical protein
MYTYIKVAMKIMILPDLIPSGGIKKGKVIITFRYLN